MSEFIHSKFEDISKELKIFLDHPVISYITRHGGGIISGGLANTIFQNNSIIKYLCPMKNKVNGEFNGTIGDVDIYFHSLEEFKTACQYIEDPNDNVYFIDDSPSGLCKNAYIQVWSTDGSELSDNWIIKDRFVKIQLIGAYFGDNETILNTFDFNNLKKSLYYTSNDLFACESIQSKKMSDSTLIDINHSNSPFLMARLNKYLNQRGYTGVTDQSHKHIQDWLIKAASGCFTKETTGFDLFYDILNNKRVKQLIERRDIISDSDLILLLGKVKNITMIQGNYKVFKYESDAIIDEFKKRNIV